MADNPQVSIEIQDDSSPTLATSALQSTLNTQVGSVTETAPASDTASSGLNGRLQRIAQRLTSIFTALSDGTQQSKICGNTDNTLIGNISDAMKVFPVEMFATYSVSIPGFSVAANPTDVFLIKGSATKKVKIRRIDFSGFQNNASYQDILLIKRSADNTGGTRVALTPVSYDSTDAAATAQVFYYTANPSALGTSLGVLSSFMKMVSGKNSIVSSFIELYRLADAPQKTITLNNANEYISVNLNAESMSGSDIHITVEWTEE